MRSIVLPSVFLIALSVISCASPRTVAVSRPSEDAVRPQTGSSKKLEVYEEGDFVLNEVPLERALSQLIAGAGGGSTICLIDVDWEALASQGIARTSPVTVKLKSPKVSRALEAILEIARQGSNADLVFFDEGCSCIGIATRDLRLSRDGHVREYNIRGFLFDLPEHPEPLKPGGNWRNRKYEGR